MLHLRVQPAGALGGEDCVQGEVAGGLGPQQSATKTGGGLLDPINRSPLSHVMKNVFDRYLKYRIG